MSSRLPEPDAAETAGLPKRFATGVAG
jgi:hypothetical protein